MPRFSQLAVAVVVVVGQRQQLSGGEVRGAGFPRGCGSLGHWQ